MAYGAPAPASMGMFKCKDCGSPVDDPTQHICRRGPGAQPSSAASRGGNGGRYDDPYDSRQPYSPPRSPYATADDRYYDGDDRRDDRRGYDDGRGGAGNGGGRSPAPRAPPSPAPDTAADNGGAAAAPKKGFGLDFLSAGYTKLFGGAAGTGGGATSPAPEQQQQQNGGGGEYDDVDRLAGKFSDSRLDDRVDDRYDDTALPPPAQGGNGNGGRAEIHTMHSYGSSGMPPSPAPYGGAAGEDPDSIELSEIMLFKDDKQVVCGGCKGLVWKGEEIVCIGADVVHATCCVCQDCGLSADRDPYGSDGWRQVAGMVVCADCLARDAQENGGASTVSAAPDKGAVVPAQQQQQQQQQRYQDDDDQDRACTMRGAWTANTAAGPLTRPFRPPTRCTCDKAARCATRATWRPYPGAAAATR
ncbi:hypothetical protein BC828DRAFT_441662 [Blastocladiella britannica]|nr:hypothetical protein BC828DRAFT_441662 [Blastocladiella britannica]